MQASSLIPLMVVGPMTAAVLLNVLHGKDRMLRLLAVFVGLLFIALPLLTIYGEHYFGGYVRDDAFGRMAVGIVYAFGGNQRLLVFALAFVAYLMTVSYLGASDRLSGAYLSFMFLSLGTSSAILLTDDIFNLYVFLEITLISQTALVIATGTEKAWKAALKYLIIANVCGNCLLFGIAMLLALSGTLNMTDIQAYVAAQGEAILKNPAYLVACALITIAAAYATGLFPFHNIKAEMYASAKGHAAGLMQTQTKFILVALGIVLWRFFPAVPGLKYVLLYLAMGAMVFGVIMALKQDNYQNMLSYHAISQAGYVAAGVSIGTPAALAAGIFHAVNNAIYKTALFIGCECVEHRTKTTDFKGLGGLVHSVPAVAALVLVAKLSISGVPPFNGFQSKLRLMTSAFDAGLPEVTLVMILVSVLTFISMMKAFHLVYMRPGRDDLQTDPVPKTYVATLMVLVMLCVLLGFYPQVALDYIQGLVTR